MAVRGLIFDMDGTLTDSMGAWRGLRRVLCEHIGVPITDELAAMVDGDADWGEVRNYLRKNHGLFEVEMDFWNLCYELMGDFYRNEVEPVAGALEFLRAMKDRGMKLGVATATPRHVAALALERTGILPLLDGFISTKDVGHEKVRPDVYTACAEQMGITDKAELVIFEDAFYCVNTLKKHGFTVVGVHDRFTPDTEWEALAPLCDRLIEDYRELI